MVRFGPILGGADDRNRQIIERSVWRLVAGATHAVEQVLEDVRLVVEKLDRPAAFGDLSESDVCVLLVVDDRARSPVTLRLLGIAPGGKVGQRTVASRAHVEHARVGEPRFQLVASAARAKHARHLIQAHERVLA